MTSKTVKVEIKTQPAVIMEAEVARKIRQHARTSMKTEVCGVLLGSAEQGRTVIEACVAGINAAQGGAHVTFTQDTWEHIYKIKDRQFPEMKIVGWYHSHPGFGVFLSEHDLFIQENFFSSPLQVAWVYDPHTDEEGCFGWVNGATEKLSSVRFGYSQGVEIAGSEANGNEEDEEENAGLRVRVRSESAPTEPAWMKFAGRALAYVAVLGLGFILGHEYLRWRIAPEVVALDQKLHAYEDLFQQLEPMVRECQERFQRMSPFQPAPSGPGTPAGQKAPQASQQDKAPAGKGNDGKH